MRKFIQYFLFIQIIAMPFFGIAASTQDSLISTEGIEFSESTSPEGSEEELIAVPEDLVFSDSEPIDSVSQDSSATAPIAEATTADAGKQSLWGIFIAGLLGGFAAFIMPCIFPMVPLTVSFFTKKSRFTC